MVQQVTCYVRHNALYCVCCGAHAGGRQQGYHPIYVPIHHTAECTVCKELIHPEVDQQLKDIVRMVSVL